MRRDKELDELLHPLTSAGILGCSRETSPDDVWSEYCMGPDSNGDGIYQSLVGGTDDGSEQVVL